MLRLCFIILFSTGSTGSPDPKSLAIPTEDLARARELVRQLGSEQFVDREKAEVLQRAFPKVEIMWMY